MKAEGEKRTYRVVLKLYEMGRVVKAADERDAQIVALLGLLETRTRLDVQTITVEEVKQ